MDNNLSVVTLPQECEIGDCVGWSVFKDESTDGKYCGFQFYGDNTNDNITLKHWIFQKFRWSARGMTTNYWKRIR